MHPVEHLLYFSVVVPHMFVYGHPIHLFFNAQHTGLTPAGGHHGFDGCEGPGPTKYSGSYFHYLHHRKFECNYGTAGEPLDRWFGTYRGSLDPKDKDYKGGASDKELDKCAPSPGKNPTNT